jgi:hypothetical protein
MKIVFLVGGFMVVYPLAYIFIRATVEKSKRRIR